MQRDPNGFHVPRFGLNFLIVALVALALVIAIGFAGLCQQAAPPGAPIRTAVPPTTGVATPAATGAPATPAVTAAPSKPAATVAVPPATSKPAPPAPTPVITQPQAVPTPAGTQPGVKPAPPPSFQPTPASQASPVAIASPNAGAVRDEWGIIAIQPGAPVRLGFAGTLSGPYQQVGTDERNAVELAVADKQAIGGIKGHAVELVAGDDRCENQPAIDLARKISADPLLIGIVGHTCGASTLAAFDVYSQVRLPVISPSSTAVELAARSAPFFFRTVASDSFQGRTAATLIARSLNAQRLAVVHDRSSYGRGIADVVRASFPAGGQVVAFESIARGQTDFGPPLAAIRPANPDAVFFGGLAADAARLVKALRDNQIQVRFVSDEAAFDDEFIRQAGPAAEGAYVTAYRQIDTPIGQQFRQRYEQRYGQIGIYSRQAYDAAMILLNAAERIGQVQPGGTLFLGKKTLSDAVRATRCDNCVSGPIWFEPSGDLANVQVVVQQVRNGRFEEVRLGQ